MPGRSHALLFALLGTAGLASGTTDSAAPAFGIEFVVAENASETQAAAFGDRFLVVWTEGSDSSHSVRGRIFRVSDGEPHGPSFAIATGFDDRWPALSTGNGEFLVSWTRTLEVSPTFGPKREIRALRVALSGELRDPAGLLVRDSGPDDLAPNFRGTSSVAWNGSSWLIAWSETEGGSDPIVPLARIDPDGFVHPPGGVISSACPRVVASSSRFLAMTYEYGGDATSAALALPDGEIENWTSIDGSSIVCAHDVASDGDDFLAVYPCSAEPESPGAVCAEAAAGTRLFSVEIDGETGYEREETRAVISGTIDPGGYWQRRRAAVAFAMDRWLIAREEFYAGRTDIYLDEQLAFTSVITPAISVVGDTGIVLAQRGDAVIGRFFRFGSTPGPSSTPTPNPTDEPRTTSTRVPLPAGDPSVDMEDSSGCAQVTK